MNSRERRQLAADKHNYERWLYLNTRGQRAKPNPRRDAFISSRRSGMTRLAALAIVNQIMAIGG